MAGRRSRISPWVSGYCSSAPNTSCPARSSSVPTSSSKPNASARVCTTESVCGWQFRQRRNGCSALGHAPGQGHGLGCCGRLIEQRGVGQIKTGEVDDHLLIVQQRFQPTLGNLRLIGRVGGVPARILQHVAQDHRRGDGAVVAHADQAGPELVLLGIALELGQRRLFIQRGRQIQLTLQADRRRHGLLDQLLAAGQPQRVEHGLLFALIRRGDGAERHRFAGVGKGSAYTAWSLLSETKAPTERAFADDA